MTVTLEDLRLAVEARLVGIEDLLPSDYKLTLVARHATNNDAHIVLTLKDEDEAAVMVALRTLLTDREFDQAVLRANDAADAQRLTLFERDRAERELTAARAELERLRGRLDVGRQMATVIYNVAQTGEWERAKQPLIDLRQAWDAAGGKRCDGDHAAPACADSECWRTERTQ